MTALDFKTKDAAAILAFAVPLLAVAAGFQLVDTLQVLGRCSPRGSCVA